MAVITISRQFGSAGEIIAEMVARRLNFMLVNKKMISAKLKQYGILEPTASLFDEKKIKFQGDKDKAFEADYFHYLEALHDIIYDLAIRENLVLLGRGGQILFKDFPPALHVKIIAPLKERVKRVKQLYGLDEPAAERLIFEQDKDREGYLKNVFGYDWFDLDLYHLVINTGKVGIEEATSLIAEAMLLQERAELASLKDVEEQLLKESIEGNLLLDAAGAPPCFAHPSEEEFARMLDFYRIKWLYEPKTFPLEWDSEGNVTEAFSPDFYLPEQDLYVEITTQKQKLAWKKNKKIRRLKELYPDVKIKIIYGRDYKSLLLKYGIEE